MASVGLILAVVMSLVIAAPAQSPRDSTPLNPAPRWEIGFSSVDTPHDAEHGAIILSTRGDEHAVVSVQRVRNAGSKAIVGLRFRYTVRDLDNAVTVYEAHDTAWTTVTAISPSQQARVNFNVVSLVELQQRATREGYPTRRLYIAISVIGVRYADGSSWEAPTGDS